MRDFISLSLVSWSLHSYWTETRPVGLPYAFITHFIHDLPVCDIVFKLHHLLGVTVACYGILVPTTPMMMPTYGTEVSTPLFYATKWCPHGLRTPIRLLFVGTFYTTRIHNYGNALMAWSPYADPYPVLGIVGFYGLYALNLYWFNCMLRTALRSTLPFFAARA